MLSKMKPSTVYNIVPRWFISHTILLLLLMLLFFCLCQDHHNPHHSEQQQFRSKRSPINVNIDRPATSTASSSSSRAGMEKSQRSNSSFSSTSYSTSPPSTSSSSSTFSSSISSSSSSTLSSTLAVTNNNNSQTTSTITTATKFKFSIDDSLMSDVKKKSSNNGTKAFLSSNTTTATIDTQTTNRQSNGDESNFNDTMAGSNGTLVTPSLNNTTHSMLSTNGSTISTTSSSTTTTQVSVDPILPRKGAAEEERHSSLNIFFVLIVIGSCIMLIHFILQTKFQYIPESLAVVFLGAAIGAVMKLFSHNFGDWKKEETLSPTMFFLILLPPIIYESGYTLHKGNFFQNIGSILVFAIIGTSISAFVIGGGVYILGVADVAYKLSFTESFAFGSLISAVDPVATLAIFHALNLDPILNMLVFGESILNDAVAIVLATTALEFNHSTMNATGYEAILNGFGRFFIVFFGSAFIGMSCALIAALMFKYVDLRKHPSLEFGMMLIFIYAPYGLAEGMHLSGIMAILFNGVVMSHYAHFNLSPVTQITMQQTLRTLAFIAETCVFAYLGLAIFSFHMKIELSLIVWSIVLCLIGRALNIYPLSYLVNYFREHKISKRMMFVMWFSGLRGAIAYALALHLDFEEEKRRVVVTTTLIIVLFTIIILGGSTMPVLKYMNKKSTHKGSRRRRGSIGSKQRLITLSKTKEMGQAIETEHLSELTEEEFEVNFRKFETNLKGFVLFDARYLMPFFTRRFTEQEMKDCKSQMTDLTNRWYQTVRRPDECSSPDEVDLLEEDNNDGGDDSEDNNFDIYDELYQNHHHQRRRHYHHRRSNNHRHSGYYHIQGGNSSSGGGQSCDDENDYVDDDGFNADDEDGRLGGGGGTTRGTKRYRQSTTTSSSALIMIDSNGTDSSHSHQKANNQQQQQKTKLLPSSLKSSKKFFLSNTTAASVALLNSKNSMMKQNKHQMMPTATANNTLHHQRHHGGGNC